MKKILTIAFAVIFCACASQQNQEVKPDEKEQAVKIVPVQPGTENKEPGAAPSPESSAVPKGTISKVVRRGNQVSYEHTATNEQGLVIVSHLVADCKTNHYKVTYRTVSSGGMVVKKDETVVENNNPNEAAIESIQSACQQKQQI